MLGRNDETNAVELEQPPRSDGPIVEASNETAASTKSRSKKKLILVIIIAAVIVIAAATIGIFAYQNWQKRQPIGQIDNIGYMYTSFPKNIAVTPTEEPPRGYIDEMTKFYNAGTKRKGNFTDYQASYDEDWQKPGDELHLIRPANGYILESDDLNLFSSFIQPPQKKGFLKILKTHYYFFSGRREAHNIDAGSSNCSYLSTVHFGQ
ncbi:MAG: hypothetical protein LBL67_01910 [Coriobacteriales bacterium]|jgi:hypothetical protein|nr:hypothetical protein [Coriobacteriales bacterium]